MAYTMGGNAWDFSQGWITKKDKAAALQTQAANDPGIGVGGVFGSVGSIASKASPVAAGVGLGAIFGMLFGGGSKKDATQTTSQAAAQTTTPTISIAPKGINIPTKTDIRVWQPEYTYNPQIITGSPYASMSSSMTSKKDATVSPTISPAASIAQPTPPTQSQTATPSITQSDTSLWMIGLIGILALGGIYIFSKNTKKKKK